MKDEYQGMTGEWEFVFLFSPLYLRVSVMAWENPTRFLGKGERHEHVREQRAQAARVHEEAAADDGRARSCEWSNVVYTGTMKHADTRRPAWIVRSQSHQVIVPHNRVQPPSRLRARTTPSVWTPETQRPWPAVLPT